MEQGKFTSFLLGVLILQLIQAEGSVAAVSPSRGVTRRQAIESVGKLAGAVLTSSLLGSSQRERTQPIDRLALEKMAAWRIQAHEGTPYLARHRSAHQVMILKTGFEEMAIRLKLIEQAQTSIVLDYYLLDRHTPAGKILLQALVRKAKLERERGNKNFKIQILQDYYGWEGQPGLNPADVSELNQLGIEHRYFNIAKTTELWKVGHRNHTKLFVVDGDSSAGARMILSGRNPTDDENDIANHYFLFYDMGVMVEGAVSRSAWRRFQEVWKSSLAQTIAVPASSVAPHAFQFEELVQSYPEHTREKVRRSLSDFERELGAIGDYLLSQGKRFQVEDVDYVSDAPGSGVKNRVLYPYLVDWMLKTQSDLSMENYLVLPVKEAEAVFPILLSEGKSVQILTNGPPTQGADPRVALMVPAPHGELARAGAKVYHFNGKPLEDTQIFDPFGDGVDLASVQIGIHSKFFVSDRARVGVTSSHWDGRSRSHNIENGIFFNHAPELAEALLQIQVERRANAYLIDSNGSHYTNGKSVARADLTLRERIMRPI